MKQNDWIILAGVVLLLLWWLSRRTETVTTTISYPNAQYDANGNYRGDSSGDLISHIIEQQGDQIQYF